jgi:hypothetical protein
MQAQLIAAKKRHEHLLSLAAYLFIAALLNSARWLY